MKYIYYYIWLIDSYFTYFFIKKPLFWFFKNIILRLFKINDGKIKDIKQDFNKPLVYEFPNCVSQGVFRLFMLMIMIFLLLPSIVFVHHFVKEEYKTITFILMLVLIVLFFVYYFDYIEKKNKTWLKKKINKKKKDFYL